MKSQPLSTPEGETREVPMITSEQVKQFIRKECKVDVVGIATATPYNEEDKRRASSVYETRRKANPAVDYDEIIDPEIFIPGSQSVIVFAENYYFCKNPYG